MQRTYRLLAGSCTRLAIALALAVGGTTLPNASAAAKSNKSKMTVKIPPEYTRFKKGGGGTAGVSARDAASGQASGKRMHKPVKAVSEKSDKNDGAASAPHGALLRGNNGNNRKGGRY